jgi:class 3 adenylate cyclase
MDLCAGKTFEFTSMGEATLKGFDEPVKLYAVKPV